MKKALMFLITLMMCAQFYTSPAYCDDSRPIWPTPKILKPGQIVQEEVYIFTEEQFENLLWLKSYYKIMEHEWEAKENIYNDALKDLRKKAKVPFWKSFRAGFLVGAGMIVLSAWAIGQLK